MVILRNGPGRRPSGQENAKEAAISKTKNFWIVV
jgi:hypothetical protein